MSFIQVGSNYFFSCYSDFHSKDNDLLILTEQPKGFKIHRHINYGSTCLFEWKKMTKNEFIEDVLNTTLPMEVGKFLIPDFCKEIDFTIEDLKILETVFDKLDEKHTYEKAIYKAYIENNDFVLSNEQRLNAYNIYIGVREDG